MTAETQNVSSRMFPKPPVFTDVEDERRHRKQRLAAALRLFGRYSYDEGGAGHITVRDPGNPDHFWVNPFGIAFSRIKVRDLLLVDGEGNVLQGEHPLNRGAFVIHSEIHKRRPDVIAAAHAHTIYGRTLAARGDKLRPHVQEACAFYEDHSVYDEYHGLALDLEEGERMAGALGDNRAVVMKHHGIITVGGTVDEAAYWFLSFDRCAQIQANIDAGGPAAPMPHEEAVIGHGQFGKPSMAYAGFQVLWDSLAEERADFLQE